MPCGVINTRYVALQVETIVIGSSAVVHKADAISVFIEKEVQLVGNGRDLHGDGLELNAVPCLLGRFALKDLQLLPVFLIIRFVIIPSVFG